MKNPKRIISALLAFVLLAAVPFIAGCDAPVISIFSDEENSPQRCYEQFIDCMAAGRYDEAEGYICNYETLGFGSAPEDAFDALLYGALSDSRSGRVLGTVSDHGHRVVLSVEFTTLDFRKVEPVLGEKTSELVYENQYAGVEYSEPEQYEQAMYDTLQQMLQEPQSYYNTAAFELDFEIMDGEWKMVCSDEFYSALIGYSM